MMDTADDPRETGAGALALVAALTLLLVKVGESVGREAADGMGEWLGAIVGAGLAVVLARLVQGWLGRRPEAPAVRESVPRKAWGARRR
jgi:hypothetical protein